MSGDGVPDWVVTPGMIERFDYPAECIGFPHRPEFANTDWYVAPGRSNIDQAAQTSYSAQKVNGPSGSCGTSA
jgi:hypothetical protein